MRNPAKTRHVGAFRDCVESLSRVSRRSSPYPVCREPVTGLFSPSRCAILPETGSTQRMTPKNGCRPAFPLRDGDRTEQAVLAPDLPGADAGVPGAVRPAAGGALQA